MNKKHPLVGSWVSSMPYDSDDYLIEYRIINVKGIFQIKAKDMQDGEEIKISNIEWDGIKLKFKSFVPSTKRKGINIFRLKNHDCIETEFTFTVIDKLKRVK